MEIGNTSIFNSEAFMENLFSLADPVVGGEEVLASTDDMMPSPSMFLDDMDESDDLPSMAFSQSADAEYYLQPGMGSPSAIFYQDD